MRRHSIASLLSFRALCINLVYVVTSLCCVSSRPTAANDSRLQPLLPRLPSPRLSLPLRRVPTLSARLSLPPRRVAPPRAQSPPVAQVLAAGHAPVLLSRDGSERRRSRTRRRIQTRSRRARRSRTAAPESRAPGDPRRRLTPSHPRISWYAVPVHPQPPVCGVPQP